MSDVQQTLHDRLTAAMRQALGDAAADADPVLRVSGNAKGGGKGGQPFGDYQANAAMALAKRLGQKPRDLAQQIVDALDVEHICSDVQVAGPGFINLTLDERFLQRCVDDMAEDEFHGLPPAEPRQTVVVDYSSPNVAKEMHVGHLRSTVIGDCIARVLQARGHNVIRQNHLGDWGTQFGMLLQFMDEGGFTSEHAQDAKGEHLISDLNAFYQAAKKKFDEDEGFARRARERVVALQSGDDVTLQRWRKLVDESLKHFDEAYERMGVLITRDDVRGESAYNDKLPGVIDALQQAGLLEESDGAKVVYPEGFTGTDDEPLPMIVRKGDGGFIYATTDLAAARYRVDELGADRVIYVTDARQGQHFAMVFQTLKQADWVGETRLEHVAFGTVLGPDKKPFKTRAGGTVKLADLLDEAESRAKAMILEKGTEVEDLDATARAIGIGALKYADLSSDRIKDYVFDWSRMLSLDGNTAPYLQNADVRIHAIFRKVAAQGIAFDPTAQPCVDEPAERSLALKLLQYPSVVVSVEQSLEPHRLCTYLFELASLFHKFYEACPVLKSQGATRDGRLRLCRLTSDTLRAGFDLLGIQPIDRM